MGNSGEKEKAQIIKSEAAEAHDVPSEKSVLKGEKMSELKCLCSKGGVHGV